MLNLDALNAGPTAIEPQITHMSLHTTGAVSSSANESTAGRVAVEGVVDGDTITWSDVEFTGGTPSGPVVRVGYWSAGTSGTYLGGALLTGDQAFNAAGEYAVSEVTETVTSA
ncbi:MAG: hypothetical protein ACO1ON_13135 [Nocardioides sp.]